MTRKPNPQLRKIVLEETNDGRDIIHYLKSTFMEVEDAPRLFGLSHKDYARSHKIAAARILARLGLEEGKRYLRRTYVPSPFKRVHPEDEDGPKRDMAASTAKLYRLVKKETNDGRDIIIRFVGIMKGYYPEYKPHLRMAAAKELIRQIEFDYEDEPAPLTPEPTASVSESSNPSESSESNSDSQPTNPVYPVNPTNPDSDKAPNTNQSNPVNPTNPAHPDSDKITVHHQNHTNHSSDADSIPNSKLKIENSESPDPYREYAAQHCAPEEESIFQSIIRRAAYQPNLQEAKRETEELIGQFDQFMAERDPDYQPIAVPDNLITTSLTQEMDDSRTYPFDPADFYDLDRDDFYFCQCRGCEECDEFDVFLEFMRELEEETDHLFEDP